MEELISSFPFVKAGRGIHKLKSTFRSSRASHALIILAIWETTWELKIGLRTTDECSGGCWFKSIWDLNFSISDKYYSVIGNDCKVWYWKEQLLTGSLSEGPTELHDVASWGMFLPVVGVQYSGLNRRWEQVKGGWIQWAHWFHTASLHDRRDWVLFSVSVQPPFTR